MKKENTPTGGRRESQSLSKIPESDSRRASLVSQTTASKRRSIGPGNTAGQSKPPDRTSWAALTKERVNLAVPTPQTGQRVPINKTQISKPTDFKRVSNGSSITQPRLLGPVSPPTPDRRESTGLASALPRASTETDLRKITSGSPPRTSGGGMSSRTLVGTKNEVRLPRSTTFQYIARQLVTPPPMPVTPERTPVPVVPVKYNATAAKRLQQRNKTKRQPEGPFDGMRKTDGRAPWAQSPSMSSINFGFSPCPVPSELQRPFAVNKQSKHKADALGSLQVKEWMPPLWWAGRFQTRFDQWRNEAMKAELDPTYKIEGIMAHCKLSQDRIAACYVFLQLRDLCTTDKAADSLWVCLLRSPIFFIPNLF